MTAVCLYFQLHQPYRLRKYSVFDGSGRYFDDDANAQVLRKVAQRCYLPATEILLELAQHHRGDFRFGMSLTGVLVEQLDQFAPEVLDLLNQLSASGCVEFLSETYHHSLACLYSRDEFAEQVALHAAMIEDRFGQRPTVFRNTELVYSNAIAQSVAELGSRSGVLAEGLDAILKGRPVSKVYTPPDHPEVPVLLRDHALTDEVGFRFADRVRQGNPLTATQYADMLLQASDGDGVRGIFLDYETFGEHQGHASGILDFLRDLPAATLKAGGTFLTPTEAFDEIEPTDTYDAPYMTSWADTERDLSAWLGNAMQSSATQELYKLEGKVKASGDAQLLEDWRRLTTSDHSYYMATKSAGDAAVHDYFNPYYSPYDAYINFMNVLDNLRGRAEMPQVLPPAPVA